MSTSSKVKGATARERQRCVNIVERYRQTVHMKIWTYKGPDTSYSKILNGVVEMLTRIEREILDIQKGNLPPDAPQYHGDFSAEEMERALLVMEEQDERNNPFEVST